jgi:HEAT repeats
MKSFLCAIGLLLFLFQTTASPAPETVVTLPQNGSLEKGIQNAFEQAKSRFPNHAFWVSYGIEVLLAEHETIAGSQHLCIRGTMRFNHQGLTLGELVTGERDPHLIASDSKTVQERAQQALAELNAVPKKLCPQSVAILFRMPAGATNLNAASDIAYSSYSLHFEMEGLPVIWVGKAENQQSEALLESLFGMLRSKDLKPILVSAIGMHRPLPAADAFLKNVLTSRETEEIRSEAISALATIKDGAALNTIIQVAKSDQSLETREQALEELSEWNDPKALSVVREIAENGTSEDLQETAMDALSESGDGVSALIQIAKHGKDIRTRRMAIEKLGDSENETARKALIEILEGP